MKASRSAAAAHEVLGLVVAEWMRDDLALTEVGEQGIFFSGVADVAAFCVLRRFISAPRG